MRSKWYPLYICLVLLTMSGCGEDFAEANEPMTLLQRLESIPGAMVEEIPPLEGFHFRRAFEITLMQPVDHNDPGGPSFPQRVYLSHYDESAPMVLVTWGYDVGTNRSHELSEILGANQLLVAHRYGGDNRPYPILWEYLTIEQAAGDHHRIFEVFSEIYRGKWVNYGASKGGKAAAFHRYFYPYDVDATVAMVAPFFNAPHDLRVDEFLTNEVGTEDCRQKIRDLQRLALSRRDGLLPYYEEYAAAHGLEFNRIGGIEAAFEYAVLEYSYIFWQYFGADECESIPTDENISDGELFAYLQRLSEFSWVSDAFCDALEPYFYQFYTETGYYGYITGYLSDLLEVVGDDPTFEFMAPPGVTMEFRPRAAEEALQWLENEGTNMIFIYGGVDPCSAAPIEFTGRTNSFRIIQPGATHFVKIGGLTECQTVFDSLGAWLGFYIDGEGPIADSVDTETDAQGN